MSRSRYVAIAPLRVAFAPVDATPSRPCPHRVFVRGPVISFSMSSQTRRALHRQHHHAVRARSRLFENISVKFGEGNRYGLIGANGCGKSTLMKILGGDLEPSREAMCRWTTRARGWASCSQDQFGFEDTRVLDVVMMGHAEMWAAMTERDAIYADAESTDDDYMKRRGSRSEVSQNLTVTRPRHGPVSSCWVQAFRSSSTPGPMSNVAPGWKLRVLLAQALFSILSDILLLDEPTNNLDINTHPLARRRAECEK